MASLLVYLVVLITLNELDMLSEITEAENPIPAYRNNLLDLSVY